MPSLEQLKAEPEWQREIVTEELRDLGVRFRARLGLSVFAIGTKGNEAHLSGAHRSQEWIMGSAYCTNRRYTTQMGLTALQSRYIAGFDLTPGVWGSSANDKLMRLHTARIMSAMQNGRLDGVNEVFGTLDGNTVTGWNNVTNRLTTSDISHLDHWHLTFDRRRVTDGALMGRVFAVVIGEEGEDMTFGPTQEAQLGKLAVQVDRFVQGLPDFTTGGGSTFDFKATPDAANKNDVAGLVARLDELKTLIEGHTTVVLTPEHVEAIAQQIAEALVEAGDNPLSLADLDAIQTRVSTVISGTRLAIG